MAICEFVHNLIYIVGTLTIAAFFYENFKSIICMLKAILEPYFQPQESKTLIEKFGKWAVITGSTDGIGKEYARELAKQGLNIVLISRTKEKLIAVASEIESQFNVKTKWIAADFGKGREIFEHIAKELAGIPIGILVNNVGKMYDYPEELDKIDEDTLWQIININIAAATMLTHLVIPQMKKQGKGAIVNISSGSELQPLPYMTVYGASKRYIKFFTQAMERELDRYNIYVQCVTPLFLVTKMNQFSSIIMKGGFLIPDVRSYTRFAVWTLGKTKMTTGYWTHGLQYFFMKMAPEFLRIRASHLMTSYFRLDYLSNQGIKSN